MGVRLAAGVVATVAEGRGDGVEEGVARVGVVPGVASESGVTVAVGAAVAISVGVADAVVVGLSAAVGLAVDATVGDGLGVPVSVAVATGIVAEAVAAMVGVHDGLVVGDAVVVGVTWTPGQKPPSSVNEPPLIAPASGWPMAPLRP